MPATLKVIGTGFGRTGTDSMRAALEILGFSPCHHMRCLIEDQCHANLWIDALKSGHRDWDVLLDGYRACVDWPTVEFWPELIGRFPEAKVLLTWRDADSWWTSFANTILPSVEEGEAAGKVTAGVLMTRPVTFRGGPLTREHCIAIYEENVARVKASVPAKRLLIYKLGDGWDPLCAFLGVDVPDVPYPRGNDPEYFKKHYH